MSSSTVDSILASYKYSYSAEIGKCRDERRNQLKGLRKLIRKK
jgi:hypothetical protein